MKKCNFKILSFVLALAIISSTFAYASNLGVASSYASLNTPVGVPLDLSNFNLTIPTKTAVAPTSLQNLKVKSEMTGFTSKKSENNIPTDALTYVSKYAHLGGVFLAPLVNTVYITFDCGYEGGVTNQILDTLKLKNVRCAFFITGQYARENPELVNRMINEGHIIGNHTWSHPDCPQKDLLTVQEDIFKLQDYVKATYNYDMKLFRYPYGYFSEMLLKFISLQGFTQMFWSYGYRDWVTNDQPDEGSSKRNIIKAACPGMIYLLHAESKTNANILGDCIDGIRAAGFVVGDCSDFLKFY